MCVVVCHCRNTTEGIFGDARSTLEKVLPTPELQEMDTLMRATVQGVLGIMEDSANQLTDGEGAKVRLL